MGTTSEKLTYLNTTKEKIRDSINLTGANIGTSDTFRSYATKLKLGLIDIINNGTDTLYSNFPKVSGIGSNLSLTPTYEAPMKLNKIQGDTFQQTYEGNNLFNINLTPIADNLSDAGITYVINNDGTITVNGTKTANYKYVRYSIQLPAGTYYFSGCPSGGSTEGYSTLVQIVGESASIIDTGSGNTFTLTETKEVWFHPVRVGNGAVTFNNTKFKPMIATEPVTYDDYEPYVGGTASPNPDYPQAIQNVTGLQNIEVCGKNLFDGELEIGGLGGSGEETTSSTNCRSKNYIEINSNTTYTLSADTNENVALRFYDENKNFISSGTSALSPNTFTTPSNAKYLRFMLVNNTDLSTQCQLEKGSTATSYEEYKAQSYEVNLGKNLYDVSTCTNAYINSTGVVTSANTNLLTDYIKIDNTQKYTISLNTEFYFIGCAYYDKNKTYLSRDTINNSSSLTITIPNNTEYIRVWMSYATNTSISKTSVMQYEPMIEKGTQRTSYSPYFTPIELNKIGTYQDYIYKSNGNWYLHQEIGKVVLDGSENITNPSNTGYSNTILRFNITVADKKYGKSGTIVDDILSNNFTCEKLDYDARTIECVAGHAAEHIVIIFIDKSRLSTENVQGFKTWLSTHNTMVYYVLATPTDTLITNTELIEDLETLYTAKSQEGTTNISITSEDLEMILNVSALKGDA